MSGLYVGARVRIADPATLRAALEQPDPALRPAPDQLPCAGHTARIAGVWLDSGGPPLYRLDGLPGRWRADWLEPL